MSSVVGRHPEYRNPAIGLCTSSFLFSLITSKDNMCENVNRLKSNELYLVGTDNFAFAVVVVAFFKSFFPYQ